MKVRWRGTARRGLTITGAAVTALLMFATPALAHHKPVMLDETDVVPWQAPLAVDGTDAVGFMGVVPRGGVRSAQFRMKAGDELIMVYLTRDAAPENRLTTQQLPQVLVFTPDHKVIQLTPNIRESVGPPGFEILRLREYRAPAVAGTYSIVVVGCSPARFTVSLGDEHNHTFDGLERGVLATPEQTAAWFANAP